jgi:phosphoglycolate phosphatase
MIKAVIFDIDGVLIDSLSANVKFFQEIMVLSGYGCPSGGKIKKLFHHPMWDALKHLTGETSEEKIKKVWDLGHTHPYPMELLTMPEGAKEVVRILSKKYSLALVTSRIKRGVENYYKFSKMKKYFKMHVSFEDSKNHKPHPDPLLIAAKRLKTRLEFCVYIGDGMSDIAAGKAAGMKTILYGKKGRKGADFATASFKEIPELIARL